MLKGDCLVTLCTSARVHISTCIEAKEKVMKRLTQRNKTLIVLKGPKFAADKNPELLN